MKSPSLHAVILAGGSGTRFWPASRRLRPKQLLALAPGSTRSLLAETVDRILPLCGPERVCIATGAHLLDATRAALPELPPSSFLGEPVARNTAPCIAWATARIARADPDALVMVLPADHVVREPAAFRAALSRALDAAALGPMTTIGITPSRPETGYGYIEAGPETAPGVRAVTRFVEKPPLARAQEYVASGRHFWNAGMFFFRASVMLGALERHLPELHAGLSAIEAAAREGEEAEARCTRRVFEGLRSVSIDTGVMERETALNVVPADFGWSDLGSWETSWELGTPDAAENVAPEGTVFVDARGNLVVDLRREPRRALTALLGVEGLCVIHTDDASLVLPRERAQDVRAVVAAVEAAGQTELL